MSSGWIGLGLLALALALMLASGWASYAVLLAVSTAGALLGLATGSFDAGLLGLLPARVIGLLEHDLLQALALYALVATLLQHLGLAAVLERALHAGLARLAPRAAAPLATLGLAALLAPMNGSVGASLLMLSRTLPRARSGSPEERTALLAVASTLGVIVPPSLVLLLLGDALMRAHTEGLALAVGQGFDNPGVRIVNTQDVLQAALLPGALVALAWLALAAWRSRSRPDPDRALAQPAFAHGDASPQPMGEQARARQDDAQPPGSQQAGSRSPDTQPIDAQQADPTVPLSHGERWIAAVVPLVIAGLLGLVALGYLRAVEAAATAGLLLLGYGLASRQLPREVMARVLDDAMALTGALFALLVAATTVSLLLRGFGTDALVAGWMRALGGQPVLATLVVLALLLGFAFVLDAFELIFLVVPILMPPLLAQVPDAAWVAALTLLVLQAGFLLPPFGYAVVLARAQARERTALAPLARALAPYLAALAGVIALVVAFPALTQWLRSGSSSLAAPATEPADERAVEELMRSMSAPRRGP